MRSTVLVALLGLPVLGLLSPAPSAADGVERVAPPVVPVLAPEWMDGAAFYRVETEEEPERPAFRPGFARRVHVEVEARRHAGAEPARLATDAPCGAVVVVEGREERLHPAELHLESAAACAEMRCLRVGPRLVASVADAGSFFVLRLAVHLSEVVADVRFDARTPTLVAPRVAFAALAAEVPAAPGEEGRLRCGDLVVTWRVTPLPSEALPLGVRALPLDAAQPFFALPPLPEPGALLPEVDGPDEVDVTTPVWPALSIDATEGIRLTPVEPGLLVLEGEEAPLRAACARWTRDLGELRSPLALRIRGEDGFAFELPVVRPAEAVFAAGEVVPVVRGSRTSIAERVADSGTALGRVFAGRTVRIGFEDEGRVRVHEARGGTEGVTRAGRLASAEEVARWGTER